MLDALRTTRAVFRSLRTYYADRARRDAMDALYRQFIRPGDLVFDVGAHVGDRVGAFRRLGARVIAVEPQPALVRTLKLLYGRDPRVTVEPRAVARRAGGHIDLAVNVSNPTVSTASPDFVKAAAQAAGWEGQEWTQTLRAETTSLDDLIARYGRPSFIKIDVEGFEAEVLGGLSEAVPALSFEFTTIQREVALACLDRCAGLGYRRFNAALGESQVMAHPGWRTGEDIRAWLMALPHEANSGDIYALPA
ncbi:MAG: FkbM family methyltransferase [Variibacter sp.]|nr:FkbM family methyltransferase [Variibacter sp.]